jgi:hypothetical protein
MKILSVDCNNCGAPLEVSVRSRFVTCRFCESKLQINRSESAVYTEVIEAVGEIRGDIQTLKLQNELLRLDGEWSEIRESFMRTDANGHRHLPTQGGGATSIVGSVIAGIVLTVAASNITPLFGLFGLLVIVVGVLAGPGVVGRARQLEAARRRYRDRRRDLTQKLSDR